MNLKVYLKEQKVFIFILVGLIALSWLALLFFGHSPYGRLNHDNIQDNSFMIIIFILSWTLMIIAMMLPSSLPLIFIFKLIIKEKENKVLLLALLIAGYLGIWILFGIFVQLIDLIFHNIIDQNKMLSVNGWLIGAIILMVSGSYQFTNLKYYCLDKCRSPRSFIFKHWQGGNEKVQAIRLGIDHGFFCVGCCWSLMTVLFLVGIGNIGWMLILSIIMLIEKNIQNIPVGKFFSKTLGLFLIGWSIMILVRFI